MRAQARTSSSSHFSMFSCWVRVAGRDQRADVDPHHRFVADDRHHFVDPFALADGRAGEDVGRLVGPERQHPAAVEAFGLPGFGDFLGVRFAFELLFDRARAGDLEVLFVGADVGVLGFDPLAFGIGRYSDESSPSEVESPMWITSLHEECSEALAWAGVSGAGFAVPAVPLRRPARRRLRPDRVDPGHADDRRDEDQRGTEDRGPARRARRSPAPAAGARGGRRSGRWRRGGSAPRRTSRRAPRCRGSPRPAGAARAARRRGGRPGW